MKRRTFVKNGMLVSSALLLLAPPGSAPRPSRTPRDLVVQVKGDSPYEITRRAVAEIGGMGKIVSRGDVVMVKPNIGWNRTVEQAGCTNPDVLARRDRTGLQRRGQEGHGHGQHLPQGRGLLPAQRHRSHGQQSRRRGALQRREPPGRPRLQGRSISANGPCFQGLTWRWTSSSTFRSSSTTAAPA